MSYALPVLDACPECRSHFIWSDLLEETSNRLTLHCSRCTSTYHLFNTPNQRRHLSNGFGHPSQIEPVVDIQQLRRGDVISFKRRAWVVKYEHHAIVTEVDLKADEVRVVEFTMNLPLRKGEIVRGRKNFTADIEPENAWVRRYMPLDCLPLGDVLEKANAFVDRPSAQPHYDLLRFNCQHLSSFCKTGRMVCSAAMVARSFYHFVLHGLQLFSVFVAPPLIPGVLLLSVTDTIVRVGRVTRTEFDLIKLNIRSPRQSLMSDALSVIATTVFVVAAVAVAGRR